MLQMPQDQAVATFANDVREKLERLGWKQTRLLEEMRKELGTSISYNTLNRNLNGSNEPSDITRLTVTRILDRAMARLDKAGEPASDDGLPLGSDFDPFVGSDVGRASWMPTLGRVAAGKPTSFELDVLGEKSLPPCLYNSPAEHPAVIIAHGDSMSPLIDDGDVVVIARRFRRAPEDGDIVAVSLAQEAGHTIKRLEILPDGRWSLIPVNEPKHARKAYKPEQIKAAAVVVGWYHPVHRPQGRK